MKARHTKKIANKPLKKKSSSAVSEVKNKIKKLSKEDRFELFKTLRADFGQFIKTIGGTIDEVSGNNKRAYLSPQDVADALGVSKPYIHKLIKEGKLEASNFGNRKKISQGDFKKFEKEFMKKISIVQKHVRHSVENFGDAYFDDLPESMK